MPQKMVGETLCTPRYNHLDHHSCCLGAEAPLVQLRRRTVGRQPCSSLETGILDESPAPPHAGFSENPACGGAVSPSFQRLRLKCNNSLSPPHKLLSTQKCCAVALLASDCSLQLYMRYAPCNGWTPCAFGAAAPWPDDLPADLTLPQ